MTDQPHVSVIVPTRDRLDLLALMFDSMAKQTYGDYELVLVDDGSKQDVRAFLAERSDVPVRYLRTEGVGAVAARCLGVSEAKGAVLAFTDSDCEPQPEWLSEGVAAIDSGADVVAGKTLPARGVRPLERTLSYSGGEGLFATCNVFYRRDAYDRAGGFDQAASDRWRFRPDEHAKGLGFGEDVLLGWRVARAGPMTVASQAVVHHAVNRPPLREQFSRAWQVGAFPALIAEIPELRKTLLRQRVFLQTRGRLLIYLAALATTFGLLPVALALAIWWVVLIVKPIAKRPNVTFPKRVAASLVELALEATKAVALIVGSARARTLVL